MKAVTKYWFLEDFNIFKKLGAHSVMIVSDVMEMDTVEKGKEIEFSVEGKQNVFFLKKGSVKITNNNNVVKHIAKRGDLFGELALYNKETTAEEKAFALEESVICYLSHEKMEELMDKHKSLKNEIFKIYGFRIQKLERRLNDLLYKDCSTRIREFIFEYLEEYGEPNDKGLMTAKNLLSHKDISNLINTSRQSVSNELSLMRKEGLITYDTKSISNLRKAKLRVLKKQKST